MKADESLSGLPISVVGHSWGAFSTMNIPSIHKDIEAVVAISGFISLADMHKQIFAGPLALWRKTALNLERTANPDYADATAIESLRGSSTRALIIHSVDDKTASAKLHFMKLRRALEGEENVDFLLLDGKGHNPNYTADAVAYKDKFFAELTAAKKKGILTTDDEKSAFVASYDWRRMTEQDTEVWDRIFDHLDKRS